MTTADGLQMIDGGSLSCLSQICGSEAVGFALLGTEVDFICLIYGVVLMCNN